MIESILFGLAGIVGLTLFVCIISFYNDWRKLLQNKMEAKREKKAASHQKKQTIGNEKETDGNLALTRRSVYEEESNVRENKSGYSTQSRMPVI